MTVYLAGMAVLGLAILAMQVLAEIDARHRYENLKARLDGIAQQIYQVRAGITAAQGQIFSQHAQMVQKDQAVKSEGESKQ